MKKTKSLIFLAVFLFVSMTVMFPGSYVQPRKIPKSSATVTVQFWYTEGTAEIPLLLKKVQMFEAKYPDIDVVATLKGFFGIGDTYETAFAAGQEPDVCRVGRDDVPIFAANGLISDLTNEFTPADIADFLPQSLKLMNYSGRIWGFPQVIDCPMFLINKQLFDDAGFDSSKINFTTSWLWSEFSTNVLLLNQSAGVRATSLAGMFFGAQPYYYGRGAKFFKNDIYSRANIDINSTISLNALQYLKDLTDSTVTPPWVEQGWSYFVGDFMAGRLAMIATGPWEITNLLTNSPQFNGTTYGNDNLGFMQLPHDSQGHYGALIGGQYYVISSEIEPDVYDASVTFVKYLTSKNIQAISVLENNHIPTRMSVMSNASVIASPAYKYVQPYYEQAVNAISLTPSPYYGRLENAFGTRLGEYLSDDVTLPELITEVYADWYGILPAEPVTTPFIPGYTPIILAVTMFASILGIVIYMMKKYKQ